jgi:potassium/hydrogen antiporter
MFVTLGLLVFPGQLGAVALEATVLGLALAFVARPIATTVVTAPWRYGMAERTLLGWAGLRGAIPVVLATFPVIEGVPRSLEFFNLVFFAVLVSTVLQGSTFEALARRLRLTTAEPALPRPLAEAGTIRRLGAEVLEYPVAEGDAIVGARVRDLGLPREAVVNVIVREDEAIPPRGSTRLKTADTLHVLVRQEAARDLPALLERWRNGPIGPPPRPKRQAYARQPIFVVRPWDERYGDPARPTELLGEKVVEQLRIRRDKPGGLWVLADGRYALTGPVLAVGGPDDLIRWARRRMASADDEERAWLQTVIGALAADRHDVRTR